MAQTKSIDAEPLHRPTPSPLPTSAERRPGPIPHPESPGEASLRELLFLQRLSKAAASTIEPDALLELIIRETTGAMQTDVCSLYLYQPGTEDLVMTATNGLAADKVGKARLKLGSGITGWVALHRQPLAVTDVTHEPRFQWIKGVDQQRLRGMLSVPIVAGSRLVGVVNVQTEAVREFTKADNDFLSAIAGQVAGILERSELQRRLETQLEEIRGSQAIHERFTALALSGSGTGSILEAIGSLAGARVELFDPAGFRLERGASSVPGGVGLSRLELPAAFLRGDSRETVEVQAGRPPRSLTLTPVRAGDELLGVLVAEAAAVDTPNRRRALEHGGTVLALELAKDRAAAEVERRLRGDLVEELLAHGLEREESLRLAAQAERLGHRVSGHTWVLAVEPDDDAGAAAMESRGVQDRLHRLVSDLCARRFPGALVVTRSASVVLLIPVGQPAEAAAAPGAPELRALETFGGHVLDTFHRVIREGTFSLGIGNATQEIHDLPRAHDEARQALRLARRGGGTKRITSYRSLGAFRLLLEVQNPVALSRFIDETLGPLLRYAESRRTPLIETLEQLSAHHWNRRAAARALHLHVNSLSYRVQRIESLLGVSLEDAETRVALSIALRARSLLRG
ncbi:MAG TPA: GAF domain-containing protein [Candidatus Dormibacteraeota bacterium]|jgi:sugar diacid utilization regulator/putative methionine-R-sulfoxide reductase with GAF domain|nr:GAF domain-containing protein [Candidatus Dormibacteraeota bacterium]